MKRKIPKWFKNMMIILFSIFLILVVTIFLFMRHAKFGKAPEGKRLERIMKSNNQEKGTFKNLSHTPDLAEGYSIMGVMYDYFFKKSPRKAPVDSLPSIKTNLLNLSPDEQVLVWFGHSSYFIQIEGKRILVDPVFSGNASPIPGSNKSFSGADIYSAEDFPAIDYLLLTHDHYDHLDYETTLKFKTKTAKVICGLGVGQHLEYWGYDSTQIQEGDWYEQVVADSLLQIHITPARHFSGRSFARNNTLWCSFVVISPGLSLFLGGDSGYDAHFAEIGKRFGPFDLAIIDNGQYDFAWRYIHALPEEVLQASQDLNTKRLFPVHSSKFVLANHAWDEPLNRISKLCEGKLPLVTPMIGEKVDLYNSQQVFSAWWKGVK